MKITTFLVGLEKRRNLIAEGKMKAGNGSGIYDGVNVKDILNNTIKKLKYNPLLDIKEEIQSYFQKAERYYLFDGKKMLLGLEDRAVEKPFEYDVTELFLNMLQYFIMYEKTDLEEFKEALNQRISETEEYKEVQSVLKTK